MEGQRETQSVIPKELGYVYMREAPNFSKALEIIQTDTIAEGLTFFRTHFPGRADRKPLTLLPKAFGLNKRLQKLRFDNVKVANVLVAEALKAGVRKDEVIDIEFWCCTSLSDQTLMETMCEGLKERSTAFQLRIQDCSSEYVKSIIEASYLKCFSLDIRRLYCAQLYRPLQNLLLRGNLYYITLCNVKGLKEDFFLQLGRCLLPNLTLLNLGSTNLPVSALKRLHGSLEMILDSRRSNVFKRLQLDNTIDDKLCYAYFRLLRSDLVDDFRIDVKEGVSRTMQKYISSILAKTKNLRCLETGSSFSSGTNFKDFNLQESKFNHTSPFGVNPAAS